MEIFKAASSHFDAQINTAKSEQLQTRAVEHTEVNANAAKDMAKESEQIDKEKLDDALKRINEQMEEMRTDIRFGYNEKLGQMYVDVLAGKSKQVIRTIPSVEIMRLSESLKEAVGIIFDKRS